MKQANCEDCYQNENSRLYHNIIDLYEAYNTIYETSIFDIRNTEQKTIEALIKTPLGTFKENTPQSEIMHEAYLHVEKSLFEKKTELRNNPKELQKLYKKASKLLKANLTLEENTTNTWTLAALELNDNYYLRSFSHTKK